MKPSAVMLLGLLAVGLYLAYNSLLNSARQIPGAIGAGAASGVSTGLSTLLAEGQSLGASLLSPVMSLGSLGTSAGGAISSFFGGSGSTAVNSSLSDLSGITSPSLLLPDGSSYSLPSDLGSGVLLPDGGSLSLGGLTPLLDGSLTAANSDGTYGDLFSNSSPGGVLSSGDDYSSDDFYADLDGLL